MSLIESSVKECKEIKEVFQLVEAIIVDVKAKKAAAEVVADVLPKLIVALEGLNEIPAEIKDEHLYETVALSIVSLVKALK